jgi:predicted GH43/DUF377 family glycosyl hydrolase
MPAIAHRFSKNPLLSPSQVKPSAPALEVACLLNPGAFTFQGKTWLIVRVAERPVQQANEVSFPVLTPTGIRIIRIPQHHPDLKFDDARVLHYQGQDYLTTLSHLRLFCSDDGIHFYEPEGYPALMGEGPNESFGIEDCRVVQIGETYYLTYTAVSPMGVGVGLRTTNNWVDYSAPKLIIPPHNKDCAIFSEKINGQFVALHRPSSVQIGGNYIWLATSPDGIFWGNHQCVAVTRSGMWDSHRIGAGAAPIKTHCGWLQIYHGANEHNRYCLGALLMDIANPANILARTAKPIMEPEADYERTGFFGHVVFTSGHILHEDKDTLTVYYGAADEHICAARFSVKEILRQLMNM